MKTTEVIMIDGQQAVKLPNEFRFLDATVAIRKEGEAVVLEPVRGETWPVDFFASIHIDDPAFARPPQREVPAMPAIDGR